MLRRILLSLVALTLCAATAQAASAARSTALTPRLGPNDLDCRMLKAALAGTPLQGVVPSYGGHSTGCQYDDGKNPPDTFLTFSLVRDLSAADARGYWQQEFDGLRKTKTEGLYGPKLAWDGKRAAAWGADRLYWWSTNGHVSIVWTKGRYYCELNLFEPENGGHSPALTPVLRKLIRGISRRKT